MSETWTIGKHGDLLDERGKVLRYGAMFLWWTDQSEAPEVIDVE